MKQEIDKQNGVWSTPQWFFDKLLAEFPMTTDVCASAENAKCARYFDEAMDGLAQTWTGQCWMNPPYGNPQFPCEPNCKKKLCAKRGFHSDKYVPGIEDWVRKAYQSAAEGSATVVCLLPTRMPEWWFDYCIHGEIRFIKTRLNFGGAATSGLFNSALVIFHAHLDPGNVVKWVTREEPCQAIKYPGSPAKQEGGR